MQNQNTEKSNQKKKRKGGREEEERKIPQNLKRNKKILTFIIVALCETILVHEYR